MALVYAADLRVIDRSSLGQADLDTVISIVAAWAGADDPASEGESQGKRPGSRVRVSWLKQSEGSAIWRLTLLHPDANDEHLSWTADIIVISDGVTDVKVRLDRARTDAAVGPPGDRPRPPGCIRELMASPIVSVVDAGFELSPDPRVVRKSDSDEFVSLVTAPNRRLPIIAYTPRDEDVIDGVPLARDTAGLAHVRLVLSDASWGPNRAARRALGRKPGKQPGAEGKHLAQVVDPDETFVHSPSCCAHCGGDLADAPIEAVEVRQVLDVPVPRLESQEHRAETRRCSCGAKTKAAFPAEARGYVSYGPKLRAIALYLMSYQHLPFERCAAALADLFGAEVSTGFLDQLYTEGAAGLEGFMATVMHLLVDSEVVHVDETFDFVKKEKTWFHVCSNELYTLLHADVTRGKDGTERTGIFPDFTGIAVHDRLIQYFGYDKATHAVCCAHLVRDLASVARVAVQEHWATSMTALLIEMKLAADRARAAGTKKLTKRSLGAFFDRYDALVEEGLSVNPDPANRPRDALEKESFNLAVAFRDRKADIVRFATDLRVPFTNNQAESDVRMVKLHAKISGPFRAMHGAERLAALRSYLQTAGKHGLGPIDVLNALFAGEPWIPQRI